MENTGENIEIISSINGDDLTIDIVRTPAREYIELSARNRTWHIYGREHLSLTTRSCPRPQDHWPKMTPLRRLKLFGRIVKDTFLYWKFDR